MFLEIDVKKIEKEKIAVNVDARIIGLATDVLANLGCSLSDAINIFLYQVYTLAMKPISSLEESIGSLSPDNVTSQDKGTVEAVKEQIESIDLEDATEDEKAALQEILDKCDELVEKTKNLCRPVIPKIPTR